MKGKNKSCRKPIQRGRYLKKDKQTKAVNQKAIRHPLILKIVLIR